LIGGKGKKVESMRKEKQLEKMRNIDPFNDWMNDFEIPQTNEWQKKILRKY